MHIQRLFGVSGVPETENPTARRWGRIFEVGLILLGILLLFRLYLEATQQIDSVWLTLSDWLIWIYFITEAIILLTYVQDKWRYARLNWGNGLIILVACPLFWDKGLFIAALRLLVVLLFLLRMLWPFWRLSLQLLSENRLGSTLLIFFVFAIGSGFLIPFIDPSFKTVSSGLWFVWSTVTTVGYGDIVPTINTGRIFSALLILLGIFLVAFLTANISAFLIKQHPHATNQQLKTDLSQIKADLAEIKKHLSA